MTTPESATTVTLLEVTGENFWTVCRLSKTLQPPQDKAVAPNAVSIAEAHFSPTAWFRAIYADDTPVGFLMLDDQPEKPEYFLWRLMISADHQGKGYGREAIHRLVDYVKSRPGAEKLLVSCVEGEGSPEGFYEAIGFVRTGKMHDDEVELALDLKASDPTYTPLPADAPADTEGRIREYFDRLINRRDLFVCAERLATVYVDHDAPANTPTGPKATIDFMTAYLADHPDLTVAIDDLILSDRKAALRVRYRGTHRNGTAVDKTAHIILHLNDDDQFIERWSTYD